MKLPYDGLMFNILTVHSRDEEEDSDAVTVSVTEEHDNAHGGFAGFE